MVVLIIGGDAWRSECLSSCADSASQLLQGGWFGPYCEPVEVMVTVNDSLHNTVIRIALVKLCKSYSRISLAEIASVLQLDDAEEARYTCMRVRFEIAVEV